MNYYRDNKGRFSKKTKFFIVFLFALAMAVIYTVAIDNELRIENRQVHADIPAVDKYTAKIAQLKEEMLKDLSLGCETKLVKEPDATIILDSNNKMSIGRYQFQITTVQFYIKKFEQREITRVEAIQIAIDADRAGKLAHQILFTEVDGWRNWTNCANKLGLPKEIEILKKLEL